MSAPHRPHPARLLDRLQAAAARRFVGRVEEVSLLREQLSSDVPPYPVLLVHGPGGVGKTTLLERIRGMAAEMGVDSIRIDGREVDASPDGFVRAVGSALGLGDDEHTMDGVCDALARPARRLFIVDTFEQLQSLEAWLRESFLPACPDRMVTVLAGRMAPQREWRTHPLWAGHAHEVALQNLGADACRQFVQAHGLPDDLAKQVVALSYGHPLALSLLSDIARSNGAVPSALAADVIRDLATRFTAIAPSPVHRHALELCAMQRRTTEESLADGLREGDTGVLFDWLAALNFVERGHDGLFPHDLVRQAVLDEWFAREPERYRATRRVLSQQLIVRVLSTGPTAVWPLVCDYNFLRRHRSPIEHYHDYRTMGSAHFRPADAGDADAIDALVAAEVDPGEAGMLRRWLAHPAAIVWVAGAAPRRVEGFQLTLQLDRIEARRLAEDAHLSTIVAALDRVAPALPGRGRYVARYHVKRGGMFRLQGGVANALQMSEWYHALTTPGLHACCFVVPEPAHWVEMMSYYGYAPLPGGDIAPGGATHGSFWREWRDEPPRDAVLRLMEGWRGDVRLPQSSRTVARLAPEASAVPTPGEAATPITRDAFAQAVREALRDVTRDAKLGASPLLASALVRRAQRPGERPTTALRRLLVEAAQEQRRSPRHERFWRALDLTYFRPAGTQELAAERLGLPFNTYRYQLARALDRLVERLWELERGE
jgi:hypothetical protein